MAIVFDVLLAVLFVTWGILSVVNQFALSNYLKPLVRLVWRIKRYDVAALLPTWTFFAPNPGTRDFNVLFRHKIPDTGFSNWRQLVENDPPISRAIWNPSKRTKKAVLDLCTFLCRSAAVAARSNEVEAGRIFLSLPYLGLANAVSSQSVSSLCEGIQFVIVQSHGHFPDREPEILFISPVFAPQ
jgi:hypothetical protein